jgi:pantothenate kinase
MADCTELRSFAELLADARRLSEAGRRQLLGITGPPGAGKSTLAQRLVTALGPQRAVLVGMDGFHLADAELRRTGLRARKGAPDTFDRAGYASLLDRLRREPGTVYAPAFDRAIEDSIAAAVTVPAAVPLVVTEGNYLLLWPEIRPLLDQIWYLDPPAEARRVALIARHVAFGKPPAEAEEWVRNSDERNAEAVAAGRERADRVLGWTAD